MKKWIISFIIFAYAIQISLFCFKENNNLILAVFFTFTGITVILSFINIGYILSKCRTIKDSKELQKELNNMTLTFKIIMIPFFIINFIVWFMIIVILTAIGGLGIIFIPIALLFTYLMFFTTSVYAIISLYIQYKNKSISFSFFLFNSFLQLCFMIDIVSYIYCFFEINKIIKNRKI